MWPFKRKKKQAEPKPEPVRKLRVSQPVWEICLSMTEEDRWEKLSTPTYPMEIWRDNKTDMCITADNPPSQGWYSSGPSVSAPWMTGDEKSVVSDAIGEMIARRNELQRKRSEERSKIQNHIEREKFMKAYCGE